MRRSKVVLTLLVLAVALSATVQPATAGKKKPKPFKSEPHALAVAHTMLMASTGERNNVTLREFENTCSMPVTQGLDAVVWEVPKEYQTITSQITTGTDATQAWDHYFLMYDKDCQYKFVSGASGSVGQISASGTMPPGIAYVAIANFAGEPADVWWEAKP